jgi:hypothetical protein
VTEPPIEVEPEYLDIKGIAQRVGLKQKSISEFARRGDMPEPDLVWLGKRLWLVDTVEAWRRQRYVRKDKRPILGRRVVAPPRTVPKVPARQGAKVPRGQKDKQSRRRSSSVGALEKPALSTISEERASEIAAALRADGHYCTTADVMVLVDAEDGELEHERRVLQQRIRQRLQ